MAASNAKTKKPLSKTTSADDEATNSSVVMADVAENSEKESSIKADFETVPTKQPEMVRIRVAENHKCCIGGTRYYFESGKIYDVPADVKRVLSKGDLLRPLS